MRQTLQSRKQCELLKSFLWIAVKLLVNVIPGKKMAVKMLGLLVINCTFVIVLLQRQ